MSFGYQVLGFGAFPNRATGAYTISNSFAFHKANDEALERTISGSSTLATKGTLSIWLKRTDIGSGYQGIFAANNGTAGSSGGQDAVVFTSDKVELWLAAGQDDITWSPVFRDTSSFYHFVFSIDTTQATDTNRVKFYVNGTQITDTSAANWPVQDQVMRGFAYASGTTTQVFGTDMTSTSTSSRNEAGFILGGDAIWVDGSALTPSSFGEINEDTGIWTPIKPDVTYGNHGFRLEFKETGTSQNSSGMGADTSGNDSHWALKHSSTITAAKNRQVDVPTDDADNSLGSYATINPEAVNIAGNNDVTLSEGNLKAVYVGDHAAELSIARLTSGKWYWELKNTTNQSGSTGVIQGSYYGTLDRSANLNSTGIYYYNPYSGNKMKDGSGTSYGSGTSTNDILQCALDLDNNKIWWGINNTWQNSGDPAAGSNAAYTDLTDTDYTPVVGYGAAYTSVLNCGQQALAYTPPTGFKTLNTANLPAPSITKPTDYFDAILYTGTGSELAISSLAFQPDMVWIKNRDQSDSNMVYDVARGATKEWHTDTTDAETTTAQTLKSFDSDGFTLGTDVQVNTSSEKYVAWCWKAGGTASTISGGMVKTSDSSTTDITRSVNTDAGFSIMTYTGNGSASTIAHGLGAKPQFIIVRQRNASAVAKVWHVGLDNATRGYLVLNAADVQTNFGDDRIWGADPVGGGTANIGVGTHVYTNDSSDTYVAYAWTPISGFSSFGKYRGNGNADGKFVYLDFQPAFMIIKKMSGTTNDWNLIDDQRLIAGNDGDRVYLYANDKSGGHTEQDPGDSSQDLDILSNGFKVRNSGNGLNKSGDDYIYCAWASTPFASNNRGF